MRVTRKNRLALAVSAIATAVTVSPGIALSEEKHEEELIVTGTPGGSSLSKLDASFAITTIDSSDIEKVKPKSTAQLFESVPGVWSESSGGVSGANIFVRGFPGSGDADFVTLALEGSPIFPPPTVSFLENSTLFRTDETILRMEALRGGPNPVYSNGQPGLTSNFLLREGSEETEGTIKYSTSDYSLSRLDYRLSGELADDLYFMIGGYKSSSPGVRDAGFSAEEGDQFTINITKYLESGKFSLFMRDTDDHGTWYLPGPINTPDYDSSSTYIGTLNRKQTIEFGPDGETKSFDFGEGRGWDGTISGGRFEYEFANGWSLIDRFGLTKGKANTLGLVPNGAAYQISDLIEVGADPSNPTNNALDVNTVVSNTGLNADQYVQQVGFWVVEKDIKSFTNDLALSKLFGDSYKLTVGLYSSDFSIDEWWALGNNDKFLVATSGGEVTNIDCETTGFDLDGDGVADDSDGDGDADLVGCGWNYDIDASGDASVTAFYMANEFFVNDALSFDIGLRSENHEIEYTVDEGLDGVITKFAQYDETETSGTVGVNYALTDETGLFARANVGNKFPTFDNIRDNYGAFTGNLTVDGDSNGTPDCEEDASVTCLAPQDLIQNISQFEFGYKFNNGPLNLYATLFMNEVEGSLFVAVPGGPALVTTNEARGLELDGNWSIGNFSVGLNATFLDAEVTKGPDGVEGNKPQRQPDYMIRFTPSYDFETNNVTTTLYGTFAMIDDRFADPGNEVTLDGYEKLDLGAIVNIDNLSFQIAIDNVTDEEGLTEGDPRSVSSANARPILPRSAVFTVGYNF